MCGDGDDCSEGAFLLEASGASFEDGACGGKRNYSAAAFITAPPEDAPAAVVLTAGWAASATDVPIVSFACVLTPGSAAPGVP